MAESTIKITAQTEQAESALASLGEKVKQADEKFLGLGEAMGTLGSAAVAGGLFELMKSSLETADQMGKLAQKAGITVESLSRMSIAAQLSDVSTQSLADAMGKLDKNMAAAQDGTGAQANAFEQLGIKVTDAHGHLKSADEIMSEVADKFHGTADGAGKTAAAIAIFGKAGAELIPMLNGGSEELKKFSDLSDQLGLTIDGKTAPAAAEINDRFKIMSLAAQGIGQTVMRDMLPTFDNLSEVMVGTATNTELMHGAAETLGFALKGTVSIGMGAVYAVTEVGKSLGGLGATISAFVHDGWDAAKKVNEDEMKSMQEDGAAFAASMDKLWSTQTAKVREQAAQAAKPDLNFNPKAGSSIDDNQKILDAAKKLDDQMLAAHEDSFTKQIEAWAKTEDQLTAMKTAGDEARKVHERAYTVFVDAEVQKRNDDAQKHLAAQYAQENQYFGQMQARADMLGKNATQREDLRYKQEILDYQKRYDEKKKDHTLNQEEEEGFQTALDNIQKNHEDVRMRSDNSVANFSKLIRNGDYQDAMTMAQAMTAGLASHSRAAFEVNKAASLANAIISTEQAVAGVLGEFPGPIGWGMAAVQAALGLAQISSIESASFGGGGSVSTPGGSSTSIPSLATTPGAPVNVQPAAATAQGVVAAAPRIVNINMAGGQNFYSADAIRNQLIPALNDAAGDGVVINVTGA